MDTLSPQSEPSSLKTPLTPSDMPPKKGGSKKKASDQDEGPDKDPKFLLSSYVKTCQSIGLPTKSNDPVIKSLKHNEEDERHGQQLLISGGANDNDEDLFGPGRCRALTLAISGRGYGSTTSENQEPIVYSQLQDLRIMKSRIGDDGCHSIAEMLRLGGPSLNISYLELMDCRIEARGALALGKSLSCMMSTKLTTLNLDYNSLKSEGMNALCRGLRTNSTLQKLSTQFCDIESDGAQMIAEMIAFKRSAISSLHLTGNRLGVNGIMTLSEGISQNLTLVELALADNMISIHSTRSSEDDISGLKAFGKSVAEHTSLKTLDLIHNSIGNEGGRALMNSGICENTKLETLKVDPSSVSEDEVYNALNRCPTKGKTGKKKKGKGGKKKK